MTENETEKFTLEEVRDMKTQRFKRWVRNRIGNIDDIELVIRNANNVRIPTYCDAYNEFKFNPELKTVVVIAHSFSERVKELVYQLRIREPEKQIILLSAEEILDGVTVQDKIENERHPKGGVLSYFKFKKDKVPEVSN